jgi:hypothetical protein
VCLDDKCLQLSINQDTFVATGDVFVRNSQSVINCDKVASAEDWLQAIEDAYGVHNVPKQLQVSIPMEGQCVAGACPTEKDWCMTYPECSESHYKEPEGSVESGAIAGFTVAGIVVLMAVMYGRHVWRIKQ